MAAVAFDTYKMVKSLRDDAKMPAEHAEGIVSAMTEAMSGAELATKSDVNAAEGRINGGTAAVARKIDLVKAELSAEIAAVGHKIDSFKAELSAEIAAVGSRLVTEIAGVGRRLEVKIAESRAELKADIAAVDRKINSIRDDIKGIKIDLLKGLIAAISVNIVAVFGVAKLLGH